MSHIPYPGCTFSDARVWALLNRIDAAEAERRREAGCPHCGGQMHSATYPRKPHAPAPALREDVRRLSFCCADCRRRVTPPSVRFFRPPVAGCASAAGIARTYIQRLRSEGHLVCVGSGL